MDTIFKIIITVPQKIYILYLKFCSEGCYCSKQIKSQNPPMCKNRKRKKLIQKGQRLYRQFTCASNTPDSLLLS